MKIKMNGRTIETFAGARVGDVLRKYSPDAWAEVRKGGQAVFDDHGHEVALDGELGGGEELFVRPRPEKDRRS